MESTGSVIASITRDIFLLLWGSFSSDPLHSPLFCHGQVSQVPGQADSFGTEDQIVPDQVAQKYPSLKSGNTCRRPTLRIKACQALISVFWQQGTLPHCENIKTQQGGYPITLNVWVGKSGQLFFFFLKPAGGTQKKNYFMASFILQITLSGCIRSRWCLGPGLPFCLI